VKYVYLAPSRRLGISLGVSPIPFKTCSYSCVYCQLGRTTCKTVKRKSYFPREEILAEVEEALDKLSATPDYITFVGEGEPTLSKDIGWLIKKAKDFGIPVAVITNGSLIFREDVASELMSADVVIPSLDAASEKVFRRINRPHSSLRLGKIIEGIEKFSNDFSGKLYIEVMLVKGYNDFSTEVMKIRDAIESIKPEGVYLMTPIRPPCEDVKPSDRVEEVSKLFKAFNVIKPEHGEFHPEIYSSAEEALRSILQRHPLREEQAIKILDYFNAGKEVLWSITERVELDDRVYYRLKFD